MNQNRLAVAALLMAASLGGVALAEPVPVTGATGAHPLVGTWTGFATSEGQRAEVGLHFKAKPDGTLVAVFDLPQTNIRNVGNWPVKQDGRDFRFFDIRVRLGRVYFGSLDGKFYALPE